MKLLLVSGPDLFEGEINLLNQFLTQPGFEMSVRKPGWDPSGVEAMLESIDPQFRSRIWVHGHPALALKLGFKGVHFGESTKPQAHLWVDRLKDAGILISAACHLPSELRSLGNYDRVLLSPVFESVSKPGHIPAFSTEDVLEALHSKPLGTEVYALGGITPERFGLIESMGFDGAALLGAVWAAQDPGNALTNILRTAEVM